MKLKLVRSRIGPPPKKNFKKKGDGFKETKKGEALALSIQNKQQKKVNINN
jgi:hypothetical protein